jgi:hypothetical protein
VPPAGVPVGGLVGESGRFAAVAGRVLYEQKSNNTSGLYHGFGNAGAAEVFAHFQLAFGGDELAEVGG